MILRDAGLRDAVAGFRDAGAKIFGKKGDVNEGFGAREDILIFKKKKTQ